MRDFVPRRYTVISVFSYHWQNCDRPETYFVILRMNFETFSKGRHYLVISLGHYVSAFESEPLSIARLRIPDCCVVSQLLERFLFFSYLFRRVYWSLRVQSMLCTTQEFSKCFEFSDIFMFVYSVFTFFLFQWMRRTSVEIYLFASLISLSQLQIYKNLIIKCLPSYNCLEYIFVAPWKNIRQLKI